MRFARALREAVLGGPHPPSWVWERRRAGGGVLMYGGIPHAPVRLVRGCAER